MRTMPGHSGPSRPLAATAAILTLAAAYGGTLWLLLVHRAAGVHEAHSLPLPLHWLRDSTLALPAVVVAVAAALVLVRGRGAATRAFAVAYAASAAVALTARADALLFDVHAPHAVPLGVLRDSLIALPAELAIAALATFVLARPRGQEIVPAAAGARPYRTTRAGLLRAGAAGVVGSATAAGALSRWAFPATAGSPTCTLCIRDGLVRMIDGTEVYMWGYGHEAGSFTVPGPAIVVTAGDAVSITVTNTLDEPHSLAVFATAGFDTARPGVLPEPSVLAGTGPIPAGASATLAFTAPAAGTYLYGDALAAPVNRVLGLHGALIVRPADGSRTIAGVTWENERIWVLNEIDPGISAAAGANVFADPGSVKTLFRPRYFTIGGNSLPLAGTPLLLSRYGGTSGLDSVHNPETTLTSETFRPDATGGLSGKPMLVRVLNAGLAVHSMHFHANHVFVLDEDGHGPGLLPPACHKDVVMVRPGSVKNVVFPFHDALDRTTPITVKQTYPMHCHAEMSQTAAGGLYPNGMLGHIEFVDPSLGDCVSASS